MKRLAIGCKSFKDGALVAAVFLVTALTLLLAARLLVPDIAYMPQVVNGFGLLLLGLSPLILLGSWWRHTGAHKRRPGGHAVHPH